MHLYFTREFRSKMAELPLADRKRWLEELASRTMTQSDLREFAEVARACRVDLVKHVEAELGPFSPLHLEALLEVPRERFVRASDLSRATDDLPLPLDEAGLATISAPHAYLLSFRLVELKPRDHVLELGTGTGYGAALASYVVGALGKVDTIEIDADLHAIAARELARLGNVRPLQGDAVRDAADFQGPSKLIATFAVDEIPATWLTALPEGGILVAPVGRRDRDQRLMRFVRRGGEVQASDHGGVRYVPNRSPMRRP